MEPETQNHNQMPPPEQELGTFEALSFFIFDFLKVFIVAVAIIIPVRYFLLQPFVVTGNSMLPNFHDGDYLNINHHFLDEKKVALFKKNGIKICVWTVNSRRKIEYFKSLGVDGIITNYPDRL